MSRLMPTAQEGGRSKVRLLLPRRKSWRLCYDRVEMVGVLRKEMRDKMRDKCALSGEEAKGRRNDCTRFSKVMSHSTPK